MKALLITLVLSGCATAAAPPPEFGAGNCNADLARSYLGKPSTPAGDAAAMKQAGAKVVRRLGPRAMATMDYRTDRLNIDVDSTGRVTGLRCG